MQNKKESMHMRQNSKISLIHEHVIQKWEKFGQLGKVFLNYIKYVYVK